MLNTILDINIDAIRIFLYSMFPVTELRASIPYFILIENIFSLAILFIKNLYSEFDPKITLHYYTLIYTKFLLSF